MFTLTPAATREEYKVRQFFTHKTYLLCLLTLIFISAWCMQASLFLNWDVSWIIHSSKRFLAGATYSQNFFDFDPPLILFLNVPVVFLMQFFPIDIALRIYIYSLIAFSLWLTHFSLKKIFNTEPRYITIVTITLACILLYLPLYDLGQRDHLMLILGMPYFFLVISRLYQHQSSVFYACMIGVCAMLGFDIKPFYLLAPLFIEIYFMLTTKSLWSWVRPEIMTMAFLTCIYVGLIFYLTPDFIHVIVPFALRLKYISYYYPWYLVALVTIVIFCMFTFIFYLLIRPNTWFKRMNDVLALILLAFILTYNLQGTSWYYHLLAPYTISLLLLTILLAQILEKSANAKWNYCALSLFATVCIALLVEGNSTWSELTLILFTFLSFVTYLSLYLVLISPGKHKAYKAGLLFLLFLASIVVTFYAGSNKAKTHIDFILLGTGMILVLGIRSMIKSKHSASTLISILPCAFIYLFPAIIAFLMYDQQSTWKDGRIQTMRNYITKIAQNRSVFFLTTDMSYIYPAINISPTTTNVSRFPDLWMIPGLYRLERAKLSPQRYQQFQKDKALVINMINEDIETYQPNLIFVDIGPDKNHIIKFISKSFEQTTYQSLPFDFINYLSKNPKFKTLWSHYRYLETIKNNKTKENELAIYERI